MHMTLVRSRENRCHFLQGARARARERERLGIGIVSTEKGVGGGDAGKICKYNGYIRHYFIAVCMLKWK